MTQSKDLVKSISYLTDDLECSVCNATTSNTWYGCDNRDCDEMYCSNEICHDMMSKLRHSKMNHSFQKNSLNRQLTLPENTLNENVKTLDESKHQIQTVGKSESLKLVKDIAVSTAIAGGQALSVTSAFGKFLVKYSDKISAGSCKYIGAVGAAIDLGLTCYRFFGSGSILSWKEFGKEIAVKTVKHASTFTLVYGCSQIGALGGPVGALVGGILGFLVSKGIDYVQQEYFPPNDENNVKQNRTLRDALIAFQFDIQDINNPQVFNIEEVKRRYRRRALDCHPNGKKGRIDPNASRKFVVLNQRCGVLMGIAERLGNNKTSYKDKEKFRKQLSLMFTKN